MKASLTFFLSFTASPIQAPSVKRPSLLQTSSTQGHIYISGNETAWQDLPQSPGRTGELWRQQAGFPAQWGAAVACTHKPV